MSALAHGFAGDTTTGKVKGHLENLRLLADDCVEGAPPKFRANRVATGFDKRAATVLDVALDGQVALRVDFDLDAENRWQGVGAHDRFRWSCADTLVLRYSAGQKTKVQVVLTDAQVGLTGSSWFFETTLTPEPGWRKLKVPVSSLRPFDMGDPRPLDLGRLRHVDVRIIEGEQVRGTLYLDHLKALAPLDALGPDGACLSE